MKLLKISIAFMLAALLTAMTPAVFAQEADDGGAGESAPTESAPTEAPTPEPEAPSGEEPAPTQPPARPNYSALTLQIALANGLNRGDYTAESWSPVEEALVNANNALKSGSQYVVNRAAKALQEALDGLVEMDYTALVKALEELEAFRESYPEIYDLWLDTAALVPEAQALLDSGNQPGVDAAAAKLSGLLTQLGEQLRSLSHPVPVVQEVEVPPSTDFCNIGAHGILPAALIVSLVLNLGLAAAIVILIRRKENRTDNTPLIDYDIDDDAD